MSGIGFCPYSLPALGTPYLSMTGSHEIDSKQNTSPRWLYLTIAILLIPLAVSFYLSISDSHSDVSAPLDRACDLQRGPCQSAFPNGAKVWLSIEPRPIHALKPLQIRVRLQGIEAQSVAVDIRGVNMNMGFNRPPLKRTAAGEYTGSWVLASCGQEHMAWEATVIIEAKGEKLAAPFPLTTSRR